MSTTITNQLRGVGASSTSTNHAKPPSRRAYGTRSSGVLADISVNASTNSHAESACADVSNNNKKRGRGATSLEILSSLAVLADTAAAVEKISSSSSLNIYKNKNNANSHPRVQTRATKRQAMQATSSVTNPSSVCASVIVSPETAIPVAVEVLRTGNDLLKKRGGFNNNNNKHCPVSVGALVADDDDDEEEDDEEYSDNEDPAARTGTTASISTGYTGTTCASTGTNREQELTMMMSGSTGSGGGGGGVGTNSSSSSICGTGHSSDDNSHHNMSIHHHHQDEVREERNDSSDEVVLVVTSKTIIGGNNNNHQHRQRTTTSTIPDQEAAKMKIASNAPSVTTTTSSNATTAPVPAVVTTTTTTSSTTTTTNILAPGGPVPVVPSATTICIPADPEAAAAAASLAPVGAGGGVAFQFDTGSENFWSSYSDSVLTTHRSREHDHGLMPSFGYMASQGDINERMRAILIDWLVDVHYKFRLLPETLFLGINVCDRYLSKRSVPRSRLQLVGVTAIWLACKREEVWSPELRDFVYITDKAYTREDILACESEILLALRFRLEGPTPLHFVPTVFRALGYEERSVIGCMTMYLIERTLQEYIFVRHAPSKIAAAALHIALRTVFGTDTVEGQWTAQHKLLTMHGTPELKDVIYDFEVMMRTASEPHIHSFPPLVAVERKYSQPRYKEVSKMKIANMMILPSSSSVFSSLTKTATTTDADE